VLGGGVPTTRPAFERGERASGMNLGEKKDSRESGGEKKRKGLGQGPFFKFSASTRVEGRWETEVMGHGGLETCLKRGAILGCRRKSESGGG